MSAAGGKCIPRWINISFSLFVLGVCLFYTYAAVYLAPYPGFEWGPGGEVASINPCHARQALCEANRGALQGGDRILAVDGVDFDQISGNLCEVPFGEYRSGDSISITLLRNGQEQTVDWLIVGPSIEGRVHRLFILLLFFVPFWLNGTLVLFVLGPRGQSHLTCLLLASFNYLTAIWLTTGAYAGTHVMCSHLVEHALSWFLVPVYLHFHLVAPSPIIRRKWHYVLGPVYTVAAVLASLELFQLLPVTAFGLAVLLAFISSLGVLILRLIFRLSPEDRRTAILMLVGITISFGPTIFLVIIPNLLQVSLSTDWASVVSSLAIPLLPFFYVYAIFKRYLGSFEARFRRGLGFYSFLLFYVTAMAAVFYLGSYLLNSTGEWDAFIVAMWTLFGVAAVPLYALFQKSFGRLAYGVTYDLADMLHAFSTQVQAVVGSKEWMRVLADALDARLLIHQSALCLFTDGEPELVYIYGVDSGEVRITCQNAQRMLEDVGRYRPVTEDSGDELDWVRLAIPLRIRGKTIGIWLFGQRDPDSYYSENDVELLTTLANQAAVIVENDRLYNKALQEIAERVQMEKALRESEERLRAILNATTESVILLDDQGIILSLNQTAARRLGLEVDALVDRRGSDLAARGILSTELLDSRIANLDQVFRSGKPVQFEDERDGVIYESSVYPIFDAEGQVRRVAIFARDVTVQRQAEQQVIQVQRLAAMGQIAGTLAHEINNPLQAIRSTLEMLVDFDLGSDQSRELLSVAIEEIQYLARVTHGVLKFTQSTQEDFRQVSATELLQKALVLAGERLESARIQVVTSFPSQPVFIFAAPDQIVQAFFSLIANAVETMPRGGRLNVAVSANGDMANLSFSSSGTFLVLDQIEHLFDPFFAQEVGSAGLGLWISRGIVERHRGTISVQNLEGGRGVAFKVALPLYPRLR
jgi:PAS domain S-box-containing protein